MNTRLVILAALAWCAIAPVAAQTLPSERYGLAPLAPSAGLEVPARDHAKLLAEDEAAGLKGTPLRYAVGNVVAVDAKAQGKAARGQWQALPDGMQLWRMSVHASGALSLDFGFKRMFLPHGAELYVASADGKTVRGPYTDADNTRFGGFWTPYVPGEDAVIELVVPAASTKFVELQLDTVNYGYRDIWSGQSPLSKSGTCEVDTVCAAGDNFRPQIRAVARYSVSGSLCTGQLMNDTAQDNKRYFSTAAHCMTTQSEANTVVVYWKYENLTCRTVGTSQNGTPIPTSGNSVIQTGGATLRASLSDGDFTLVELNAAIPTAADPFWYGWDRSGVSLASATVIHHPNGDEKRISFANGTVAPSDVAVQGVPGLHHMHVPSYNLGTTEPGSSGSGLINAQKRVVGFLSGGAAACSNNLDDYYGRFAYGWDTGTTASSRLRDWLDAGNTGAQTLDGKANCTAPQLNLTGAATGSAGQPLSFTVSATGSGPFRVDWDVDNDGVVDRSTAGVASSTAISINYPTATSTNVSVRVFDSTGCAGEATRAINVSAPDLVPNIGTATQLCGNGDSKIDPGERWQVPVSLFNSGAATVNGGVAVYSKAPTTPATVTVGPDSFGYAAADDATGCGYSFVDLDSQASVLALTASGTGNASDDGHTALIATSPFNFYGASVTGFVMSTNGYLSASASDSGGDYDNACGLTAPDRGSTGARINVLHDDLVVGNPATAGLRSKFFASCPRRAESASGDSGCYVFQWSHMGQYSSDGPAGDFDAQAILYPATSEIVYQYRNAPADQGASATIGIQNAAVTAGLQYACNSASVRNGRSVCIFHPSSPPLAPPDAGIRIETPAVSLPNLSSGQSANANLVFAVKPDALCGAPVTLNYVGTVDNVSYSVRSGTVLSTTLGNGGACQVSNSCAAQITPIALNDGLYANPSRFGNGEGVFTIPAGGQQILFGAWFTGEHDRSPSWLIVQGTLVDNQAIAPVLRFHQNPGPVFGVTSSVVGTAQITVLNANSYAFTWTVDGAPGGQVESHLYPFTPHTSPNRTGAWFFSGESGWGQVIDDHMPTEEVAINYIYDGAGDPVWTLGATPALNSGTMSLSTFRVHCPSCANFPDFGAFPLDAGTLSRVYSSVIAGTLSTQMQLPGPLSGSWIRSNVPIQMLSVPGPQ